MLFGICCDKCAGPLEPAFKSCLRTKTGTTQYIVATCVACNKIFQIKQEWETKCQE